MAVFAADDSVKRPFFYELFSRFLVLVALAYICGIISARLFMEGLSMSYWLGAGFLVFLGLSIYSGRLSAFRAVALLIIAATGAVAFYLFAMPAPGGILDYRGYPVYVEGTVTEEPLYYENRAVYHLRVETVETKMGRFNVHGVIQVSIYGSGGQTYTFAEKLRLRGTVVEPRGLRNPGGFDYRFYLRSQGVDALMSPLPAQVESLGTGDLGFLVTSAVRLRSAMIETVTASLPSPQAELLTAIILGERNRLPQELEDMFRRAGVGHLMAVSGLHVGLVAAFVLGMWRRLGLRGPLPLVLAIVLVFAYAYLTGMRPSALRAAITVSAALCALLLDRERDLPIALALAALVTLVYNPLLLFSVGFQLSYAATAALIYAYRPMEKVLSQFGLPQLIRSPLAVTVVAQLGVVPISLYYFHHLPTGALFFNLLLLPLLAFVVGLGLSGALVGIIHHLSGSVVLWAARPLLELMILITAISRHPWFYIAVQPPSLSILCGYYICFAALLYAYYRLEKHSDSSERDEKTGVITYLAQKYQKVTLFGRKGGLLPSAAALLLIVAVLWAGILWPDRRELVITVVDVGQGACALIETPGGTAILVDAGGAPSFRGNPSIIGEKVVLPFLRSRGIRKLDLAVITHAHEDHFGGFMALVEAIGIDKMLISPDPDGPAHYFEMLETAVARGTEVGEGWNNQIWRGGDGLVLEIIGPPDRLFRGTGSDLNNNSIVFMLRYGDMSMLFTGDIEDSAVGELLRRRVPLQADILLVPHHGGFLEAMPELLEAVKPSLAVIQVGPNSFGHPHPYVLAALEEAAVKIYRTDVHGAVVITSDGASIQVKTIGDAGRRTDNLAVSGF